ncbi:MAG: TlpA family protein disulfide reductase [Erysipelotrichaceae bacterium]
MESISEGSIYSYLSEDLKKEFKLINDNNEIPDYVLRGIGRDLSDITVTDLDGNELSFNNEGKTVIEVVAYWCPHCKDQIENNEILSENYPDISFYQYFNEGDNEQIAEFYEGNDYPESISIIPYNEELSSYFMSFDPQYYPTFFFFEDGKCTYICHGDIDLSRMDRLYSHVFSFRKENMITDDGLNIFDVYRDGDTLYNELSDLNKNRLEELADSEDFSLSIMSKPVNFNELYEKEGDVYSLNSFSDYISSYVTVFYLSIFNLENDIEIINKYIDEHPDVKVLSILCDNDDMNTSEEYAKQNVKLKGDVSSSKGYLPKTLHDLKVEYPTVIFIRDNLFMGGFSDIDSDKLNFGYITFLSEECIALKENN